MGDAEPRGEGGTVVRAFVGDRGRYDFDLKLCPASEGWRQYDTEQDAWYFGVWYHPDARIVVTYAEGDLSVEEYTTNEAWTAQLASMAQFYGPPPPAFIGIDANGARTDFFDAYARPVLP